MDSDDDVEAILDRAARHIDRHELTDARRLLTPLIGRLTDLVPVSRCRLLIDWGWLRAADQHYAEARTFFAQAAAEAESLSLPHLVVEALREAGIAARLEGRRAEADVLLARSAELAAPAGLWVDVGQAMVQRAAVAHLQDRFVDGRRILDELAEVLARCPEDPATWLLKADYLHHLGVSARVAGDFDHARTTLIEARDIYRHLGRRVGEANAHRELGAVLENLGDRDGARVALSEAFVGYLRSGRALGAANAARRLGQLLIHPAADDADARKWVRRRFEQALRLGQDEQSNAILTHLMSALLDRLTGDLDAAEVTLTQVLTTYFTDGRVEDAARHLSQIAQQWGMLDRARGDREAAIEHFAEALLPLDADADPGAAGLVHYEMAFDLILDDQVTTALEHALAAFRLSERTGRRLRDAGERRFFYRDHRETYVLALHCAARAQDGLAAFEVATAARAEALSEFVRSGARLAPELREVVTEIALATGDQATELYARLERLTSAQLRSAVTAAPASLADAVAALPAGGHALLLDVLEDENTICSRVWIRPDATVLVDEVRLPDGVREFLDRYRDRVDGTTEYPQDDDLAALGRTVMPDGLADLLGASVDLPLVISTGSLLSPVPVAAMRVNDRYLAELAHLVIAPALTLWMSVRQRPPRPGTGVIAFHDPRLAGSAREIQALRAAFPDARSLRRDEVREALADAAEQSAVVLSVHGAGPQSGLRHALVLADGDLLTAGEMLTYRLPEAVVMSACWAGRVDMQTAAEPLGLPTAALLAGARWILAGTIEIGDASTGRLLKRFYAALAAGATPAAALAQAQRRYLAGQAEISPRLWAGLTIVGDGFTPLTAPDISAAAEVRTP